MHPQQGPAPRPLVGAGELPWLPKVAQPRIVTYPAAPRKPLCTHSQPQKVNRIAASAMAGARPVLPMWTGK